MNLYEALRADADSAARRRSQEFSLPAVIDGAPRLVAVCRPIGYPRFRELQDRAGDGYAAELEAAGSLVAECTDQILVDTDGVRHDLGDYLVGLGAPEPERPGPTQFDERLAAMLGLAAQSRREVVEHVIPDELARVALSNRVVAWLAMVHEEAAAEALGE